MSGLNSVEGMEMFEIYEANGSLLYVSSALNVEDLQASDVVYRRAWATAAKPVLVKPYGQSTFTIGAGGDSS